MYLNTHSYYSFKYGTMSPVELLEEAATHGVSTMVLTDVNSTAGCMTFIRKASDFNITPLIGIDFRNGAQPLFVGIARNTEGFRELNAHLSSYLHQHVPPPPVGPDFQNAWVIYPYARYDGHALRDHEFIGVAVADLTKFRFSPLSDVKYRDF